MCALDEEASLISAISMFTLDTTLSSQLSSFTYWSLPPSKENLLSFYLLTFLSLYISEISF